MSEFQKQFQDLDPKKIGKYVGFGVIGLIALVVFIMSWTDIDPGEEGFIYRPYGGGVEKQSTYGEGTIFIAPWNEMITYNTRQQSKKYIHFLKVINFIRL